MTVASSGTAARVFPPADHCPCGEQHGAPPGDTGRSGGPFGLRFATAPTATVDLDLDLVDYDEEQQIAVARDGDRWVPLARHSMGVTLQTSGRAPHEDEIYDKS